MERDFVPVIIVGAGPVGLVTANLLGLAGIETLLVERSAGLNDLPRAISLDDEGLRVLQALELGEALLPHILQGVEARYLSAGRLLAHAAPSGRRYGYPLISTFAQPQVEAALLAGLRRFPCVRVRFECTLEALTQSDERVYLSLRTATGAHERLACAYLLACDGGRSQVRHSLRIPMLGSTFGQRWLVVDTVSDPDPSRCVAFYCEPRRPTVCVPAPHNARRWEFMLLPGERAEELLAPERVRALVQQAGGPAEPRITRQAVYTFHASLAASFARGRVFLLGDAAHLLPPFGGQGLNSGLRDAHNLAWKIALVLRGRASPALLATYEQERRPHAARMIRFSTFLGSMVMPTSCAAALLRDSIVHTLRRIPAVATLLREAGIKPQPRYRRGLLLRSGGGRVGSAIAGCMLPQPQVLTTSGARVLLDEVLGNGFALLRLHPDPSTAFAPLTSTLWQRLDVRRICICPASCPATPASPTPCTIVGDIGGELAAFLRGRQDLFVLVRPDRYCLGAFYAQHEERFVRALNFIQ